MSDQELCDKAELLAKMENLALMSDMYTTGNRARLVALVRAAPTVEVEKWVSPVAENYSDSHTYDKRLRERFTAIEERLKKLEAENERVQVIYNEALDKLKEWQANL